MASLVSDSRFKTIAVSKRTSIKALTEEKSLIFKKGRGFYQLNKPELIQDYKEIVVRRRSDEKIVSGDKVRELLGVPKSSKKFKLDLTEVPDFEVFVQSTSVNRVLLPGTEFLYEIEEEEEGTDTAAAAPPAAAKGRGGRGGGKRKVAAAEPAPKKVAKKEEKKEPAKGGRGRKGAKRKAESTEEPEPDTTDGAEPSVAKKPKAAGPPPPRGPVEIVFSFDTTGSMYPCLTQVRQKVAETVKRLQREIPGIRIAIIGHGDYCDGPNPLTTMDFSSDEKKLCDFVKNVPSTGGGDFPECYELVLNEVREKLSWTPGTQRSLVMIGDATPHPPTDPQNRRKLDWKVEAKKLHDDLGVRIYAVQALNRSMSDSFYQNLASLTEGYHLHLDQFSSIVDFMMAICFREQSIDQLQVFEDEVRKRGSGVNRSIHKLFDVLAGRETTYSGGADTGGLVPVNTARFQILDVDVRCDIRTFVQREGLIFKPGRGFYEFTKPEKISDKKEVVLVDKVSGDVYTGAEACRLIGAGGSSKIKPTSFDKWRVFVQSTSYNRVLMPSTGFLYEVDPDR